MYHIYQTEGWILGSVNVGEANRFLDIFTSDLGLVRGVAQGVRKLNSKLRYGLQDYSYGKISFVKGKQFWRIVNVEKMEEFSWIYGDKRIFQLVCRIFSLLRRLVKGEEKDVVIFEDINSAIRLMNSGELSDSQLANLEIVLVFRILHKLGYVGRDSAIDHLIDFHNWRLEIMEIGEPVRTLLLKQINHSLLHSHL